MTNARDQKMKNKRKAGGEMNERSLNILWAVSLIVIVFTALLLLVTKVLCLELPDLIVRVLGFGTIIALPVFVFSNIKRIQKV